MRRRGGGPAAQDAPRPTNRTGFSRFRAGWTQTATIGGADTSASARFPTAGKAAQHRRSTGRHAICKGSMQSGSAAGRRAQSGRSDGGRASRTAVAMDGRGRARRARSPEQAEARGRRARSGCSATGRSAARVPRVAHDSSSQTVLYPAIDDHIRRRVRASVCLVRSSPPSRPTARAAGSADIRHLRTEPRRGSGATPRGGARGRRIGFDQVMPILATPVVTRTCSRAIVRTSGGAGVSGSR